MPKPEIDSRVADKSRMKEELEKKGEQLVSDMNILEDELNGLGSELDDETRASIEKAILSAQDEVERTFESEVEGEALKIEDELNELLEESESRADTASSQVDALKSARFEFLDQNILNDAADEAEKSEQKWIEQVKDIDDEKEDMQSRINSLKSMLGR